MGKALSVLQRGRMNRQEAEITLQWRERGLTLGGREGKYAGRNGHTCNTELTTGNQLWLQRKHTCRTHSRLTHSRLKLADDKQVQRERRHQHIYKREGLLHHQTLGA